MPPSRCSRPWPPRDKNCSVTLAGRRSVVRGEQRPTRYSASFEIEESSTGLVLRLRRSQPVPSQFARTRPPVDSCLCTRCVRRPKTRRVEARSGADSEHDAHVYPGRNYNVVPSICSRCSDNRGASDRLHCPHKALKTDSYVRTSSSSSAPTPSLARGKLESASAFDEIDPLIADVGATAHQITYRSTSGIDGSSTVVSGVVFVPEGDPPPRRAVCHRRSRHNGSDCGVRTFDVPESPGLREHDRPFDETWVRRSHDRLPRIGSGRRHQPVPRSEHQRIQPDRRSSRGARWFRTRPGNGHDSACRSAGRRHGRRQSCPVSTRPN